MKIALSFDVGYQRSVRLGHVLRILREYDIKSTFYFTGSCACKVPDDVRAVRDDGHEIGNHTMTHPLVLKDKSIHNGKSLTNEEVAAEIAETQQVMKDLANVVPVLFRPPHQTFDDFTIDLAHQHNLKFSLGATMGDWRNIGIRDVISGAMKKVRPDDALLFHMSFYIHMSLPAVIELLMTRRYTFCRDSELPRYDSEQTYQEYLQWCKGQPGYKSP